MIREMAISDVETVAEIESESFLDPWTEKMFLDLFSSPVYKNYVVTENDEISGYMSVIATKYVFEIINIAVKKEKRNKGLGFALINKAKNTAKDIRADKIFLEVRKSNSAAIGLYLKSGFKFDGERKGYYPDGEDALLLSCTIEV